VSVNSLQELYSKQLSDLYSAEQQIVKALPKMIDATQSEELRDALNEHLNVTKNQVSRLEKIFEQMGERPENEKCKGMEGVLQEGSELLKELEDEDVRDAGIIASAQRVEHYEIAGYGTARTFATLLGQEEAAELLEETLQEEKDADEKLSEIAEELNFEAADSEESEGESPDSEEREPARGKSSQKATAGRASKKSPRKKSAA
jgi:ferritin-like metal-binding protein YciE